MRAESVWLSNFTNWLLASAGRANLSAELLLVSGAKRAEENWLSILETQFLRLALFSP